jgi:hypothetical protein
MLERAVAAPRFGDETHTGQLTRRGADRVTLAARAESSDDFNWWHRWLADFAPEIQLIGEEPKSDRILRTCERNPSARRALQKGLGTCSIFVMSIRENTTRLLDGLRKINPRLFAGRDPLKVLEDLAQHKPDCYSPLGEFALRIREQAISDSTVGSIEALISFDGGIGEAMRKAGLPTSSGADRRFDREAFQKMTLRELEEFSGRFAIMVADALSPQAQARAIEESLVGSRFFQGHAVAVRAINRTMTHNYLLDSASSIAITRAVESAHGEIEDFLRQGEMDRIIATVRPGTVGEEDSRKFRGLQVADVAAGFARDIFELSGKPTLDAAKELKEHFDGVFLNDRWL